MSNYYNNQESIANIYVGLVERGWKCYGYKADQSDMMTDYWSPARWEGIAEKDGYILLVDAYSTSYSGYKVTKQGFTVDHAKIEKLKATINDSAASQNEKETSQKIIDNMMKKQKESTIIIEEYPTFKNANPKGCNWHIEKDGNIIAKGKGAFQCDGYLHGSEEAETMKKVNAFIDKIEKHIADNTQLVPVIKKTVKKVIKPVEVTDRKTLQIGDVLSFSYHGHYWEVYSINEERNTFSYELLGSEKRGYQKTKNGKRYYDYMKNFDKNLVNGSIKLYTLQEVEEVTEKVVYKKAKRDNTQKENLLQGETVEEVATIQETIEETTEVKTDSANNEITYTTGTGSKGNGIEINFTNKPSEEVRNQMKAIGFRWGGKKRPSIWWAVMDDEKLSLAKQLAGETIQEGQEEKQPLNDINTIMSDLAQIEDITEPQLERIEKLLSHWNHKEMAVLKEIYIQDNGNVLFKAIDKRKGYEGVARYSTIFKTGESGYSPSEKDLQYWNIELVYTVKETHNSDNVNDLDYLEQLTPEQQEILATRLEKDHVKPLRLLKDKNNTILLECINLNHDQDKQQPFYFSINTKGNEKGKGYDYKEYLNEWEEIHSFSESSPDKHITEETPKRSDFSYPTIDIDDITDEKYKIPQSIIDREHDANWIFRRVKKDYNKEIQEYFQECNDKVIQSIGTTDNQYYIYKLKDYLQRYKKKYHSLYLKYLTQKGSQVSWAVSGRGNLNVSRYNKKMNQIDKTMLELAGLPDEFKSVLSKYQSKIRKEKTNLIKEAAENTEITISFATETKEFTYMNMKEKKRVYVAGEYWISKLWGMFRVFKGNKEIDTTLKTTSTLNDAKKYVVYLINQDQQKAS
ncbi:hypothetical protein [Metabacillus sp. Hm71]|uniref:hypothetical protein n=1 Tax=Metabacillus sp. Hm71 TaxID=3450743 RepID=UPI003F438B0D